MVTLSKLSKKFLPIKQYFHSIFTSQRVVSLQPEHVVDLIAAIPIVVFICFGGKAACGRIIANCVAIRGQNAKVICRKNGLS